MGLEQVFKSVAVTAAKVFDGVFIDTTYIVRGTTTYNAATSVVNSTPTTIPNLKMMFTSFKQNEIDNETILATDVIGVIPQNNLSVIPKVNDEVTIIENAVTVTYDVKGKKQDAAGALWKIHLRRRS